MILALLLIHALAVAKIVKKAIMLDHIIQINDPKKIKKEPPTGARTMVVECPYVLVSL